MKSEPLFSICIPTYNRPKELAEAIYSITTQLKGKLKDIVEIVISEDAGSNSEATKHLIEELMKQYDAIRYFKNQKNMRFWNGVQACTYATWKYLIMLSDDDYFTDFSLTYLAEIVEKTWFDFLIHKPFYTPDVHVEVPKPENIYTVYQWVHEYITGLYAQQKTYNSLIWYFSFNSIMVVKASYWNESYNRVDKAVMFANEFPQEFPPYFNLKYKIIVLADGPFVKGRLLNAQYKWTRKLIDDFKITMNFIEKQNDLAWLPVWKIVKRTCITGWSRTMYIGMFIRKLNLDYKMKWFMRWFYFVFKKYLQ